MVNFKEVLLVVNPISGGISKKEIIEKVRERLQKLSVGFHLYTTSGKEDIQDIKNLIGDKKIDHLLVGGGDGTINLVADAIKELDVSMGIIPAGSANGLAVNLNIPKQLDKQIDIALGGHYINMDVLCLNEIICLHMSDLGINAELIRNYEDSSIRGKFGYLLQSLPTLIQSEFPFHFTIETEDFKREEKAVLLGIANANKYGTGANVNPKGKPDDGVFEILIFKRLNFMEIIKTLRNEVDLDPSVVEILPVKSARIKCRKPEAFQADGEYLGKVTDVQIRILPQKLKIAVPKPN
ncbi:diacylglycerol kinase [Christiangramia fulva]|uniref:Diacylglycerol kinase n=1 Tax=Christiangramia fulva TaxID=2126553 RepID=A0A2R3Z8V0_9FLAO|nr:diacylglycerol kinase family protein [Christiangramia fulva]AVR46706.1 diacylglycerol kinase [Christiangramia fulva]